jgi:hypothetical protein
MTGAKPQAASLKGEACRVGRTGVFDRSNMRFVLVRGYRKRMLARVSRFEYSESN